MMNQESEEEFSQEIPANCHENGVDSVILDGFTVLKLPHLQPTAAATTTTATASTTTSIPGTAIKPLRKCSSCGSAKKRSPPPPSHSSFHEPSSKRASISTNLSFPDPSPPSSAERKRDPLRRSVSDFPSSPGAYQDFPTSAAAATPIPGNSKNPLALLRRSPPTDPFSSDYDPPVNTTPPRPPAFLSPQMFHQGSPNSKKLKELKERVEELMQWMGQVQEDEDAHQNDVNKEKAENQTHDSVWVKQTEGGLILHFKCPCGEGYEVFLHGEKCYYRLT